MLDIQGDVDFSTGDINFIGDINIEGDVLSGFTIRAMGNIHVGGVVEAGSSVEAGGDLVVVKGILGDGTTVTRSHRSVFSKYIENATIYARENLQTDCIINGSIYCDGEVRVRSGRGCIMGGRIWAAKMVNVSTVGAQSECRTSIALGGLPCTNFEREIIQKQLKDLEMELEKLECQLDSPTKSSILGRHQADAERDGERTAGVLPRLSGDGDQLRRRGSPPAAGDPAVYCQNGVRRDCGHVAAAAETGREEAAYEYPDAAKRPGGALRPDHPGDHPPGDGSSAPPGHRRSGGRDLYRIYHV